MGYALDILDSRDLEDELAALEVALKTGEDYDSGRLRSLRELKDETEGYGWEYGIQFIPVVDFAEYAEQFAEDCGMVFESCDWPNYCIDWERAARDLAMDYSLVTFEGIDYYYQEA